MWETIQHTAAALTLAQRFRETEDSERVGRLELSVLEAEHRGQLRAWGTRLRFQCVVDVQQKAAAVAERSAEDRTASLIASTVAQHVSRVQQQGSLAGFTGVPGRPSSSYMPPTLPNTPGDFVASAVNQANRWLEVMYRSPREVQVPGASHLASDIVDDATSTTVTTLGPSTDGTSGWGSSVTGGEDGSTSQSSHGANDDGESAPTTTDTLDEYERHYRRLMRFVRQQPKTAAALAARIRGRMNGPALPQATTSVQAPGAAGGGGGRYTVYNGSSSSSDTDESTSSMSSSSGSSITSSTSSGQGPAGWVPQMHPLPPAQESAPSMPQQAQLQPRPAPASNLSERMTANDLAFIERTVDSDAEFRAWMVQRFAVTAPLAP